MTVIVTTLHHVKRNKFPVKRDRKFGQSPSPYARIPKRFAQKYVAFALPVALMRLQTKFTRGTVGT